MNSEIIYKDYATEEDLHRYREIFSKNGSSQKPIEFLHWMHTRNPNHLPLIKYAIDASNNETAALYTTFAVSCKFKNSALVASQSIDTITDIQYRGQGLFINLAKKLYEYSKEKGIAFVYGFPNQNSVSGFLKKLAWKEIDEVPFIMKLLRPKYLFTKTKKLGFLQHLFPAFSMRINKRITLPAGYEIKKVERFDHDFDALWNDFSENINVSINRNAQYMNWRLIDKPFEDYLNFALYHQQKPVAFISYCVKEKHGGRVGYVMEYMYKSEAQELAQQLFQYAMNDMNRQKTDIVLAWCLRHSSNYQSYMSAGFYYLKARFRPIQLFFGALDLQDSHPEIYETKNWYLSYLDSDTV